MPHSSEKPRLLHIINSLARGGAETLLVQVIRALDCHYSQMVVMLDGPNDFVAELPDTVSIINLQQRAYHRFWQTAYRLRGIIRRYQPHWVHSHLYWASVAARLACPRSIPLFFSLHGIYSADPFRLSPITRYIEQLTYRPHHHLIAVSETVRNDYAQQVGIKGNSYVLYNTICPSFFSPHLPLASPYTFDRPLRLVSVGNLHAVKNQVMLIEALRLLHDVPVQITLYGKGHLHDALSAAAQAAQVPLYLAGQHHKLWTILPNYDAFVLPSLHEGFSIATLEAMASGLPTLLSDIPTLREVNPQHALFFSPQQPQQLADHIRAIAQAQININALAHAAKQRARQLSDPEQYMLQLRQIYESNRR